MRNIVILTIIILSVVSGCAQKSTAIKDEVGFRRIPVKQYVDKMKAGWVGQMAGDGWGAPTEFKWKGSIIPDDKMPKWKPEMINQFDQDDIYVEMTFLRTLELYGFDVSIEQAGIDFANSGYKLWHANKYGRNNLRKGIAPPDSGHPKFSRHADDIDYQIEADYSGLIAPGMGNIVIELGDKFGRLMNYGDGVYGGQFVGGMYSQAFFETDIEKIIAAGLKCIPKESQYHECITDVIKWYKQNPDNWEKTWELIEAKYHDNPEYRRWTCNPGDFNIDVKINGAYIVMGMLYGQSDLDKTIVISTRCGQDSDCNPSNAAGVLFTSVGFSKLPDRFTSAIDPEGKFSHTPYNFPKLTAVCEKLAREAVKKTGGRIEKSGDGSEVFVIPVRKPKPSKFQPSYKPGPIANSHFTKEQMAKINPLIYQWTKQINEADLGNKPTDNAWADLELNDSDWKTMDIPCRWEDKGLKDLDGIVWFRKQIDIPDSWTNKELTLNFGPIDDVDTTFINGQEVGSADYWQWPRRYSVSAGIIKPGKNIITVRVIDSKGMGGLTGNPEQFKLQPAGSSDDPISLAGTWKYKVALDFDKIDLITREPGF